MKFVKIGLSTVGVLLVIVAIAGSAFRLGWLGGLTTKTSADKLALAALNPTAEVGVQHEQWMVFTPTAVIPKTGFIFYPCALCDARGFAKPLHAIAAQGFLTVLVPMPSNFAIFDIERALEVKTRYPDIKYWVIGGHSMGGGAAAMFVHDHPDAVDGLLMWDSYTNDSYTVADLKLPVMSIYGDHHHSADRPTVFNHARQFMPPQTDYRVIVGGDHFQFGDFDLSAIPERISATIPRAQQQQQVVAHSVEFLHTISKGASTSSAAP